MAISSISALSPSSLLISNSSSTFSSKTSISSFSFSLSFPSVNGLKHSKALQPSQSLTRVFAAPEALETQEAQDPPPEYDNYEVGGSETPSASSFSIAADADKMAPKQKIRIKLRSYWVPLIEDSCKQIMDAAKNTNAKTMGPVPLPTKKRIYCVLKSPHVHKDARFHFEIRTHQRLIDILYPTAQTIDSLMQLDLPAGVDVEVKL
ncbi:hypothetical protein HS088_TW19G00081 [Tripterygium wilfordii]|uniref:Small ribosomal subunit protein uS10c n=1 Tax=Tripterygium wilfordii TaxID=458696 RepID=A0A7J7C8L2_TRIWF|nr:30S ribosomal protein S10, chloroplastic-like [Tripterygium wilfordii]XP_038685993.1 30S ribosomal protein S10, chloroplastic-like [Tripterygium wilfordii]KAF5730491.1 hypothetical protein HS088_TW19G00081 [Tripterygium wilfordii]